MEFTSSTLTIHEEGNLFYTTFPAFDRTGKVHHAFSTRRGGMSQGYYASMNLGFKRGDDAQTVMHNFQRMSQATGIYVGDMVFSDQVHGDRILYVDQQYRGSGILKQPMLEQVDGLITDKKHVALVTFHADCVPLFFLDPVRDVIGLAHAGWKGTLKKIGASMIHRMREDFGSDPADILVGIGPSIGPCCFEVGADVFKPFREAFPQRAGSMILSAAAEDKRYLDLWQANEAALLEAGVTAAHITVTDLCTKCHPDYYFSHRFMGNRRGTMAAFLELY
ncbi:MAG: peptidoglycan editing factor PgeF [Clostridiales bacterium]|nr:peptidoglycan editing factor PgeF [Clostridiales bacterium]